MKLLKTSITAAALTAAALAAPAASNAAVTIGSNLNGNTNDNLPGYCGASSTCTLTNLSLPPGSTAAGGLMSPINGVVVSWKVKSNLGLDAASLALRVLRPAGGATYTGAGTSASIAPAAGINTSSAQLPIRAGDSIGLNNSASKLVVANTPGANALAWGQVNGFGAGLTDGTTGTGAAQGGKEILVQATVEPDADNDGLGDETQDPCPSAPGPVCPPGTVNDTTKPKVTQAKAKPKKFEVGPEVQITARKKSNPKGTTFSYKLSEPATVTFTIQRAAKGRKVNGKCVKQTKSNKKAKKCTRYKQVGTLTQAGAKGKNTRPFSGRINGKALKAGKYRALITGVDGAGNPSSPAKAKFEILKKKK